jgi:hypothetical protein
MMPAKATYLFELLPPIGHGSSKESVRVQRFGLQLEAFDYAKSMVAKHRLSGVKISRLTSEAMRLDVGEYPEGASDTYHATMLVESQSLNASNLSRLGYSRTS